MVGVDSGRLLAFCILYGGRGLRDSMPRMELVSLLKADGVAVTHSNITGLRINYVER